MYIYAKEICDSPRNGWQIVNIPHQTFQRGNFIRKRENFVYYLKRNKAIPGKVLTAAGYSFGLVGSDVLAENPVSDLMVQELMPVTNMRGQRLRFALAGSRGSREVRDLRAKIAAYEPLNIGTSYPNLAVRELARIGITATLRSQWIEPGCIESLPEEYPELDAIFELTQTGDSFRDNDLVPIVDDILGVNLLKVTKSQKLESAL